MVRGTARFGLATLLTTFFRPLKSTTCREREAGSIYRLLLPRVLPLGLLLPGLLLSGGITVDWCYRGRIIAIRMM